ncbi:MAG: undecaprenyl diphosphate synthase family protein [Mycoplasmoidaceae bacterium]|nr:undecaprenyl diphosphate synthase family protein [Mycoplasmoidaceae bacterium]
MLVQNSTKNNSGLKLNIVFNYSGLKDIEQFKSSKKLVSSNIPDIDLLIRTSGEKRISNFLLCQLAYSELVFEKTLWPDYTINILKKNIIEYKKRNRRFGKI